MSVVSSPSSAANPNAAGKTASASSAAAAALHENRAHSSRTRTRHHSHSLQPSAGFAAFELLPPVAAHRRARDSSTSSSEIDLDLTDPDGALRGVLFPSNECTTSTSTNFCYEKYCTLFQVNLIS